jgi:dipeptidyl aminopeptidase/acylaminoacyl peptidase
MLIISRLCRRTIVAGLSAVLSFALTGAAAAQQPGIEQFMKIRAPNSPTLAPDGTLYVRDWPDGIQHLYSRAPGAKPDEPLKRLTDNNQFKDGINSYALSRDGRHIVISAAIGGSEQTDLYHLDTASGAIKPLLVDPNDVATFGVWLEDNSGFLYTTNATSPADFHVYRYELASGNSTKLLDKPGYWTVNDVSADGKRALVGEYFSASHSNAYELDTATGTLTKLNVGPDETANNAVGYLPGEKSAALTSDFENGIMRLYMRDLPAGEPRKPFPDLDEYDIEAGAINEDRTLAAITYNEGGYGSMRVFELPSFKIIEIPGIEKGVVGSVDIEGRTLAWTLSNARTPGLTYSYTVGSDAGGGAPAQITVADTQSIDLNKFPLPELITYKSFDGQEIPAFIFLPPNFRKGEPVPFVVNFHGGPEGQSRPSFNALTQFLLSRGYGVMMPNVRGSTGYGRDFHMLDNYKQRWDSVKDGAEAARWLTKNGYAEAGRIAAYGGSYGGFMSVATVIEGSDVFGASVDVVGIVNFKTFLEQTKDYRRKLREAEYGPLSDPEFLASISPLNRIDEIKCPMMIAHGLNDPRVPVGEAMQLAVGLQRRGYDPELVFCPDEGHGFAKLENRLLFADRMAKFLDRTIGE